MIDDSTRNTPGIRNQVTLKHLVSVIFWTALFTLAYAQSPLYTSNQNQYFLHGLANAGFGTLNHDWLAATLDPTPIFSGLIYLTGRFLFWPPIFYIYYGILAGTYLFSIYGIVSESLHTDTSRGKRWTYLTALLIIHSAALRFLVVRIFNTDWAFLFDGGVAGQRLLGSVFQPSTFGVFLCLSIYLFLRGKITWAVVSLVIAPIVHPTYLLSAAILTLVYMVLTFNERKNIRASLAIGTSAALAVTPTLVHTYLTFRGTDPISLARARELLVIFRIPHHAIPAEWFDGSVVIKLVFVLLAIILTRKTRLFHILFWPFVLSTLGSLTQVIIQSDVLALLFPWRLSAWLVPLSASVVVFWILEQTWPWIDKRVNRGVVIAASLILGFGLAVTGLSKSIWEYYEKKEGADRPMMAFVAENLEAGSVYLVPLDMQDFRLETGAPAYVEFKSIPYKDVEVLEWYRRVKAAGNLYRAPHRKTGCRMLAVLYSEGVTNVVLPVDHKAKKCSNLVNQYTDENYQVYRLTDDW
jgi:hypothetical protein